MTAMLDPGTVARQWWHETFGRDDAGARTARAQLRRCATVLEVLTVESPHRLSRRLRRDGCQTTPGQIAVMALGLAHIREPGTRPIARVFGERKAPNAPPRLGPRRFERLLRAATHEALFLPLRAALAIVRNEPISIEWLARDLYHWNATIAGRWCYQYYGEPDMSEMSPTESSR